MEDNRAIETAEGIAVDQQSSVQASIQGALKSASSNNERVKRASAVRFADQVHVADEEMARLNASGEDPIRQSNQESLRSSQASNTVGRSEPVAKVKGRQLVGSVEIEEGQDLAEVVEGENEEGAGQRRKSSSGDRDEDDGDDAVNRGEDDDS